MNRKKKISGIYNKKLKKAKSHLNPKANNSKAKYISKADREKQALEAEQAVMAEDSEETTNNELK